MRSENCQIMTGALHIYNKWIATSLPIKHLRFVQVGGTRGNVQRETQSSRNTDHSPYIETVRNTSREFMASWWRSLNTFFQSLKRLDQHLQRLDHHLQISNVLEVEQIIFGANFTKALYLQTQCNQTGPLRNFAFKGIHEDDHESVFQRVTILQCHRNITIVQIYVKCRKRNALSSY